MQSRKNRPSARIYRGYSRSSSESSKEIDRRLAFVRRSDRFRRPNLRSIRARRHRKAAKAVRRTLTRARSIIVGERFFGVVGVGAGWAVVAGGSAVGGGGVCGAGGVAAEAAGFQGGRDAAGATARTYSRMYISSKCPRAGEITQLGVDIASILPNQAVKCDMKHSCLWRAPSLTSALIPAI